MANDNNLNLLWNAFDITRGSINMLEARKYIYNLFYFKCISDNVIKNADFDVSKESKFEFIVDNKDDSNLGETINRAIDKLEKDNPNLRNSFIEVDFSKESISNEILTELVNTISELDLKEDSIAYIFESLLNMENKALGKRGGNHFTPIEISELLAKLMSPKKRESIHDPTAGTGTLLAKVGEQMEDNDYSLYAQDINKDISSICKMNLILHGMGRNLKQIETGNIFSEPKLLEDNQLKKFDVVVSDPTFSLSNW